MRKLLFFPVLMLLMSVLSVHRLAAQTISSRVGIEVVESDPRDSLGSFFYPYKLLITQEFTTTETWPDSLQFALKNTGFFQYLMEEGNHVYVLVPDMQVRAQKPDGGYQDVDFTFDGANIFIPKPETRSFEVCYGYYSDMFSRIDIHPLANSFLWFEYDWNSWYFTPAKLESTLRLEDVSISLPDNLTLFANTAIFSTEDGVYTFDTSEMDGKALSFYLADNKWFVKEQKKVGGIDVTLFLTRKEEDILDDIKKLEESEEEVHKEDIPQPQPLKSLAEHYKKSRRMELKLVVKRLKKIFPNSRITSLTILEDDFKTRNGSYAVGKAVCESPQKFSVLVDRTFWGDSSLAHELVHGFLSHDDYDRVVSRQFFDEAMVEYFANYAFYSDLASRNEAFDQRIEYFLSLPTDEHRSILEMNEGNNVNTGTGGGTWGISYYKVPFLIHRLACKMGQKQFLEAVAEFYREAAVSGECLFDDFGAVLCRHGLSEKDWQRFKETI